MPKSKKTEKNMKSLNSSGVKSSNDIKRSNDIKSSSDIKNLKNSHDIKSSCVYEGETVKVDYVGTLDDGIVFDASERHGGPLEFKTGAGQLIRGFDQAVIGMNIGDEKTIHIESKDAYGDVNPDLVREIPREKPFDNPDLKIGMQVIINLPNGMQFPARVAKLDAKIVTLDLNHPLAGKDLNFKIKLVEKVADKDLKT